MSEERRQVKAEEDEQRATEERRVSDDLEPAENHAAEVRGGPTGGDWPPRPE
jgi:hypothetical protein